MDNTVLTICILFSFQIVLLQGSLVDIKLMDHGGLMVTLRAGSYDANRAAGMISLV